jgi:outer membrane protein assembly factor BamE (lipoprotein component of BamABCDE complex)
MRSIGIRCGLALFLIVAIAGCTTEQFRHFTRQNFETLRYGQPDYEVREVLGEPTTESDGEWTYVNTRPYYKAILYFDDEGRLVDRVWYASRSDEPGSEVGEVPGHGQSETNTPDQ